MIEDRRGIIDELIESADQSQKKVTATEDCLEQGELDEP
jgi:hypothetical protein